MKLPALLTSYFYQYKHLNLPGLGTFHVDPSITIPDPSDKNFDEFLQYIRFTHKNITKPDDDLIDFIRAKTGKIKPLAESDLESFLGDGKLLLNIGKPFHIEGIGTLQKLKEGVLDFIPGGLTMEKIDMHRTGSGEEKLTKHKPVYGENFAAQEANQNVLRKVLIFAVILVGISIIVGGGYFLYNSTVRTTASTKPETNTAAPIQTDTLLKSSIDTIAQRPDSVSPAMSIVPGSYKFVFESTNRKLRALRRYAHVRSLSSRIQMETKDSVTFKIYTILPALSRDTSWKKDSLNAWYWGVKEMRIKIEQ